MNYFKRIYIDRWKECKIEIEVDKIESEIDRKLQKLIFFKIYLSILLIIIITIHLFGY